jgi:vanillate O-demethylase monooxygenase subunit
LYLRNAWYVAACDHDIRRNLTAVKILDEDIVLYRKLDGAPVALENACPHRKLPLSMGRLKADDVECGYHGLTFDCAGACVRAPGMDRIPPAARVRSYPVSSRYGLLWIWMGDADKADETKIFRIEHWGDPAWGLSQGDSMMLDCHYLHMTDNLLDPTHVAWVHQNSFGNAACETEPLEMTVSDSGVTVWRWMRNVDIAPFYAQFVGFTGTCDRKQHYEVRYPCLALSKAIFVPSGTGGEGRTLPKDAFVMDSYSLLTPVDENQTKYFWLQLRNVAPDNADMSARFATSVRAAFEEDRVVLAAVHRGMAKKPGRNLLRGDAGGLRFRRQLARLVEQENNAAAAAE